MKFTTATATAAVLVLAAPPSSDAFTPSFVPRNLGTSSFVSTPRSTRNTMTQLKAASAATLSMFAETSGGMEQLQELTEQSDAVNPLGKQLRKSPSFFKFASLATIPLSAALGFGIVPSRRFAAHTVGAVVTGIAGAVGKSKLDSMTEDNAKPALAQAIIDYGLDNVDETTNAVNGIQDQFGLLDEDFETLCTDVYSAYLLGMVKYNPKAKTSELKELDSLKKVLSLDNLQIGEAHSSAAQEWYRTTCLFTPEEELDDPDHPDRLAMDKLLFLTERAFRQAGETDEAFIFEMTRVAKAVSLDYTTALERVADTAEPFYQRALQSTRSKLGSQQVSPDMLERARKTLGISEQTAFDMHIAAFNEEVRELLGLSETSDDTDNDDDEENEGTEEKDLSSLRFHEEALERLDQLQEVLGLSDTDTDYEITAEATPLYQSTALAAMRDVLARTKTPDEAWEIMDQRRAELLLPEESSKSLVSSMVMQALGVPLEETNKFAKVNNEAATYDHLLEALEAKEALISILTKSGWEEFDKFDETFCNPWDKQSANGFLLSEDRIKLYRIFLNRSVLKSPDGKLSDEMFDRIKEVQGLLGITDQQTEIEARGAFGKKLKKVLQSSMTEIVYDYTEELAENMKSEIDDIMKTNRLTEDYLRESASPFYNKAVELVSDKSPAGVPTKELAEALEALRELYKLTDEDAYPAHMEHFGSVYRKSIVEAMGQTGVIRPEFKESLDDLKSRLGVSADSAKELFLQAVEEKMKPMVEWIGSEMERTMLSQQQLAKRRGKDMGEDLFQTGKGATGVLGLGAEVNIMSDIMELVDFYVENDLIEESESGDEKVYPVTALGLEAIDQELAELLYRQFIVGAFQSQGPNAARYEASRETWGGILGLSDAKKEEIGKTIGNTVYDNFVSNAMKTKGAMDQQDMMFLANIQGKLGLSSEQGEKMMLDAQKKVLSEEIEAIMDAPSPEAIKEFREKCNTMGLDLIQDVGVSKPRLIRMFESEIIPGLKSGEINADDSDILGEIQESLALDPDECEAMFENVLGTLAKNAFGVIKGEMLRGREENTVDLLKELVRYAAFTGGDLGLQVDETTANSVVNIYDAMDFEGEDPEQVDANKELLRAAMGLSS